ncbi:hypothetical protein [Stomatobaculum longum]|uniref:hypothetical protein n=1 Tax=Stomatobaculum longum TaxID=796942 RepID=UPI00288076D8|nr:hypothetical protein [Stomatobaculum longum]
MGTNKYKLFWKVGDVNKHVVCQKYSDDEEYYSFLKKQYDIGYRQIIISSEVMIQLIKEFVMNFGLRVYRIEFMEADSSLTNEIEVLLDHMKEYPILFVTLLEKLNFLAETTSIDIGRIYTSGKSKNNSALNMFVQSNGIIGINDDAEDELLQRTCTLIERHLFG